MTAQENTRETSGQTETWWQCNGLTDLLLTYLLTHLMEYSPS